nr:PREDICTED: microtubule-associated protein Jupiter isoform X1 [Bemisia tabaci]
MKPPGGYCHDLFGASFNGSPCHNRVLKPPGGGSSDIFGSPEPPASHSLRKTRTYDQTPSGTAMNGTKSPTDSTPSSAASSTGNNSHFNSQENLNGDAPVSEPDAATPPSTPDEAQAPTQASEPEPESKPEPESERVEEVESALSECSIRSEKVTCRASSETVTATTNGKKYYRSDSHSRILGDGSESDNAPSNGTNGQAFRRKSSAADKTDGNPVTGDGYEPTQVKETRTTTSAPASDLKPRQRVPPGGFSSGLW